MTDEIQDKIDIFETYSEEVKELETKIDSLCYRIFNTAEGVELLNILEKMYITETPVADPNFTSSYCYFREGQNSIIRDIRKRILSFKNKGDA